MSGRRFRLELHDSPVSWVDAASYPLPGGCHIICLSDRQCAAIRDMVYPMATQPTRFASRVHGDTFEYGDPVIFQEHLVELHDLLYQIGEGSSVACTELVAALTDLAAAIAAGAGGSGGQTVVNCGGGGGVTNLQVLADCIGQLPADAILPGEDIIEGDPAGAPPDGFDTWEQFRLYKCKAAHWIVDSIINSLRNFGTANIVAATLSLVTATVAGALAAFAAVLAPPAFLAIVVALVQLELLAAGANSLFRQVADYLAVHRNELICAMYNSGSAGDAVAVVSAELDDAIEALEYGGAFAALSAQIAPLLTTIATQVVDRKIFQTLWEVSADVVYFDADCDPCDPWYGYLMATSPDSPYNVLERGDSVTFGGSSADNGYQVVNPTSGRLYFTTEGATTTLHLAGEYFHAQSGWTVLSAHVYRASDDVQVGSFTVPNSNSSWQTISSTASITLAAATQYYVGLVPEGGNSTWNRRYSLQSL